VAELTLFGTLGWFGILIALVVFIIPCLRRIVIALERIADVFEEGGDEDDGGGRRLTVSNTRPKDLRGNRLKRVLSMAEYKKHAADSVSNSNLGELND